MFCAGIVLCLLRISDTAETAVHRVGRNPGPDWMIGCGVDYTALLS